MVTFLLFPPAPAIPQISSNTDDVVHKHERTRGAHHLFCRQCFQRKRASTCACDYTPKWLWTCLRCCEEVLGPGHCDTCDLDFVKRCENCGKDAEDCKCAAFQG